jgi:nicotinate-nucleotide adenylyltransferase
LHAEPAGRVLALRLDEHPASASEIRRRLGLGLGTDGWLPPAVEDYIRTHGLYGARPAPGPAL